MNQQILRYLQLLNQLPREPKKATIEEIKTKLENINIECTIRTLQRDMVTLSDIFPERISSENQGGRKVAWFWKKNAPTIKLNGLTLDQALSFSLSKQYLIPLLPPATLNNLRDFFDDAEATLNSYNTNDLRQWLDKVAVVQPTQPLLPAPIDSEIHDTVCEALLFDCQLEIQYRRSNDEIRGYCLNPLGLVARGGVMYLIATKVDSDGFRIFALHRMTTAHQTIRRAVRPAQFDLQSFIDEGRMGFDLSGSGHYQRIRLKVVFDHVAARHLYETPLTDNQTITPYDADHVLVTAELQETEQLFWWLLSFGVHAEVLEPIELRNKMAETAKAVAKKYTA